jgi:hypothetical protein
LNPALINRRLGGQGRYRKGRRRLVVWLTEGCKILLLHQSAQTRRSVTSLVEEAVMRAYQVVPAVKPPPPALSIPPGQPHGGMRTQRPAMPSPAVPQPDWIEYPDKQAEARAAVPWQI